MRTLIDEEQEKDESSDAFLVEVHLSRALVLQAYRSDPEDLGRREALLSEARSRLARVFDRCRAHGLFPDAGAAALMQGVVFALSRDDEDLDWFYKAVEHSSRGQQMETLWRSHINAASAGYEKANGPSQAVVEHSLNALRIMQESLPSQDADSSPRFRLIRVPMLSAVRFLLEAKHEAGRIAVKRFPRLRTYLQSGAHELEVGGTDSERHYPLVLVDGQHFVLY